MEKPDFAKVDDALNEARKANFPESRKSYAFLALIELIRSVAEFATQDEFISKK